MEKRVYSQNGEDGVIEFLFQHVGSPTKYYVEIGTENGTECNTRNLRENHGWKGIMFDCSYENSEINLCREMITADNIKDILCKYAVPIYPDLFSLDIDYNDWYVLRALLDHLHPRVMVLEYNAILGSESDSTVIYDPTAMWDGTNYFGASLMALTILAKKHGYTLVYCENRGVNAFFVRDDLLSLLPAELAKTVGQVATLWKPPIYGRPGFGHPEDPRKRPFASAQKLLLE